MSNLDCMRKIQLHTCINTSRIELKVANGVVDAHKHMPIEFLVTRAVL